MILSDVDASGTIDLLRIDPESAEPWQVWSFADRPGLLATLPSDLGYTRAFTYRPAAALAIDDANLDNPWSTTPTTPSPVLVQSDGSDPTARRIAPRPPPAPGRPQFIDSDPPTADHRGAYDAPR